MPLKLDVGDVIALSGLIAITYGLAQYSLPLVYIFPGCVLVASAVAAHRRRG